MNRYYYDLHIHSCLSPCGDDDMTPNNIAGMGVLNGLNIMALTDHNTTKNCPAFFKAAKKQGIIPIAGMELTTAEDIHVVCLFPTLELAMEFDSFVEAHRIPIPNRTDIFGFQQIMNENDEVVGEEANLLSMATDIMIDDVYEIVKIRTITTKEAKHLDEADKEGLQLRLAFELKFNRKLYLDYQKIDTHKYPMINHTYIDTTFDELY